MAQNRPTSRRLHPGWIAAVCGMASFIDAAAIVGNGTALVLYQDELGLTANMIGVLSAALTFSIALGAVCGGRLGDRFGRRRVFSLTMIIIVVGCALLTFGTAYPALITGVILLGAGTGADLPVSLASIAEAATDDNRGALIGLSNILWVVGITAVIAMSAYAGDMGRLSGQLIYGMVGVVSIVVLLARVTIPESPAWLDSRDERRRQVHTVGADGMSVRALLQESYSRPFVVLLLFYVLTNLAANTAGQFNAYIAVNVADLTVETFSRVGLLGIPLALITFSWFMKIVDGPRRMNYFAVGALLMLTALLVPVFFGFSLITMVINSYLSTTGAAFAFEGIMKVWTQESFPTLLRSTAQGIIIAVARIVAGFAALGTPALLGANPRLLYLALAVVTGTGLAVGWFGFRRRAVNAFATEQKQDTPTPSPLT